MSTFVPDTLSPATRFVAACCRWPRDAAAADALRAATSHIKDWGTVHQACRRHRVVGLVYHSIQDLADIPQSFTSKIKLEAQKTAIYGEWQAQEAVQLEAQLAANNIRSVQFKGPSLSHLAYGSLSIKRGRDVDILVGSDDVREALVVLEKAGYRMMGVDYPIGIVLCDALIRHRNQIALQNPEGLLVELHWRFANAPGLLPGLDTQHAIQCVTLEKHGDVTTLGEADLFAYLCLHGALHDWSRLRWLADVAALAFAKGPQFTEPLLRAAEAKGAGLAAHQAQLLSHQLLGTPAPLNSTAKVQQLADYAQRRIEAPYNPASIWGKFGFSLRQWWMQRHFYPNSIAALGLLKIHRASLDDLIAFPLPAGFDWLYLIMRAPMWLHRRFSRGSRVPRA